MDPESQGAGKPKVSLKETLKDIYEANIPEHFEDSYSKLQKLLSASREEDFIRVCQKIGTKDLEGLFKILSSQKDIFYTTAQETKRIFESLDEKVRQFYPGLEGKDLINELDKMPEEQEGPLFDEIKGLWKTIIGNFKRYSIIDKKLKKTLKDIEKQLRPIDTPEAKALLNEIKSTPLIRASLHTEKQKFGRKPTPAQPSLFELLDIEDKKKAVEYGVEVAGIDITGAQTQALFAIQRLLNETNYKGNLPGKELKGEGDLKFYGYLPSLKFTPAQYLEAYGVKKYESSRGYMEFSGEERKDALRALRDLNDKRFFLAYERKYWKEGKELYDVITTIRPLLIITQGYEALTKLEKDIVSTGVTTQATDEKLKTIAIEPCPMLVDQIDTYFVLKPANYYQEIKLLTGHSSKFVYRFVDFLLTEVTQREIASKGKGNQGWIIEISLEALAYKLRMDSWIKGRGWKQIRGSLKKCYEIAKGLGYVTGFEIDIAGKTTTLDRLILNPDKFKRMKAIEEERKLLELRPTLPPS